MAKLRVHSFDSFQKGIKEGIFNPGFITELEEESIDNLTDDKAAPAPETTEDAAPAEEAPAEQTTEADKEQTEEAPEETTEEAPEADLDYGADETEASENDPEAEAYQSKVEFVSGVFDEYKKYLKSGGLVPAMKKKIDAAFDLLNKSEA